MTSRFFAASVGHLYRRASQRTPEADYAFEMASSTVRYGPGVTREVGMDVQNLGITKLCVITDQNVSALKVVMPARNTNLLQQAQWDKRE